MTHDFKFMEGHSFEFINDRTGRSVVHAESFPHRCPGVGCAIREWLRQKIARGNYEKPQPRT